ncbi:MAG: ferritin-like domain-containing protein [Bacteriovorax sp.]|nr:ferritin-like domain-containing protein [Bacteriovorax sp.]
MTNSISNSFVDNLKSVLLPDRLYNIQHLPKEHGLNRILKIIYKPQDSHQAKVLWDAKFYGLNNSTLFQGLSELVQNQILQDLTDHNLFVAYHVEVTGFFYCSKMILLSETVEEHSLYARMCADEAQHLNMVTPYLTSKISQNTKGHKLLKLISEVIQDSNKEAMVFLTQVVLEGWGIPYYQDLKDNCLDESFQQVLRNILADEAYHYSSGVVLFDEKNIKDLDLNYIGKMAAKLIQVLRIGAAANLKSAIEGRIKRELSQEEIRLMLEETCAVETVLSRSSRIEKIVRSNSSDKLQSIIAKTGVFDSIKIDQLINL